MHKAAGRTGLHRHSLPPKRLILSSVPGIAMPGAEHDGRLVQDPDRIGGMQPVMAVFQYHVHHHHVRLVLDRQPKRVVRDLREAYHAAAVVLDHLGQEIPDQRIVVHDQYRERSAVLHQTGSVRFRLRRRRRAASTRRPRSCFLIGAR